ncbi:cellulose binding domain-containing protein [Streptomyces sp. NPDC006739]|uniref:cellulose binding domain-containing protein n=1 Tax=Streptomyces sp. NPDC006739 TaxID=3364763 RepID=UPI00368C9966
MRRLGSAASPGGRAATTAAALVALLALGGSPALAARSSPSAHAERAAATAATVTVDTGRQGATIPATAIGLNASVYDGHLTDAGVPQLVKDAGVGVMRFPGGTTSDEYDWKTNQDVVSKTTQATDFDQFMTTAGQAGVQPMITVNYGTGDTVGRSESPQETGAQLAADWVRYANVEHHHHIKYWEIGNEVYGNGTYGGSWEPDEHCGAVPSPANPTTCGPSVYAQHAAQYIAAMKAVDPTISIGVVLTAPGSWPDGQTSAGSPQPWNQTVLTALKGKIDFADVHWYPQNPSSVTPPGPTDAGLLADTAQIPGMVNTLRTELGSYAGDSGIPMMLTETNSVSSNPGKQTIGQVNALYLLQDYTGWLSSGVANVDWWQLHNGIVTSGDNGSSLYGTGRYGEYGVLSDGSCGTSDGTRVCEPTPNTPYPAYYGLKLLGQFIHPGDTLVSATSSQSLVNSYAVKAADGSVRVLLVNDDPATTYSVALNYAGFTPGTGSPGTATLAAPGTSIDTAPHGTAVSQTLAPYSATVLTLRSGSGTGTGTCSVHYAVSDWGGGMTGTVTVTNTGNSPVNGWTLGFTWPGNQRITQGWNATWKQNGTQVTATSLDWNQNLAAGASTTVGFTAGYSGSNPAPTSFTLNGGACDS